MNNLNRFFNLVIFTVLSYTLSSCSEDVDTITDTSISYTITISPDLLKLVTPQVSYVDENGVLVTITGVEELDRKVLENSSGIASAGIASSTWTALIMPETGYKCWTINMKFKHLGFHSRMSVKYLRNSLADDISNIAYDFHHDINTSVSATKITTTTKGWFGGQTIDISSYVDYHISLPSRDYHYGDNVESYLIDLVNHPDKAGYYIDANGDITKNDEFQP